MTYNEPKLVNGAMRVLDAADLVPVPDIAVA
jgi:hypothetical protein